MKFCIKILAIAVVAATAYSLTGCGANVPYTYQNVSVSMASVNCEDCTPGVIFNPLYPTSPAYVPFLNGNAQPDVPGSVLLMSNQGNGGTQTITATVNNAPGPITWTLYPQPNLGTPNPPPTGTGTPVGESGSSVGSITVATGNTAIYIQGGIPNYTGQALLQTQQGIGVPAGTCMPTGPCIPQGMVLLVATVPSDPTNPSATVSTGQFIQIYSSTTPTPELYPSTPTTPTGITAGAVTLPHGTGTFQFNGYVIGDLPCGSPTACAAVAAVTPACSTVPANPPVNFTDNCGLWEVGPAPYALGTAVLGGDATYGTITQTGLYTAPAVIPPVQPVVIFVAHAAQTLAKYANVTIN
jgi:hypothetical protein